MDKEQFDALSETEKIQLYYDTLGQDTDEAKWSTAFINDLPDISFAVIASGGEKDDGGKTTPRSKRHLPHHGKIDKHTSTNVDEPHLKNAASRVNQLSEKGLIPKAKGHLRGHYKAKGWELSPNLESDESDAFEDITYTKLHIVEDKELHEQTDGEYHRIRMMGSVADKVNQNKRLYPKEVWENNLSRMAELMTRGRFVGHANHPYRGLFGGSGGVEDIVIKFEDVWFGSVEGPKAKSNEVWLEGILIPTSKGLDIAEIAKADVELGVSSRGYGTQTSVYKPKEKDEDEPEFDHYRVNMDYEVDAFDLVYMPAEDEARVYAFEHKDDDPMDLEEIRERYPELVNAIEGAVKEPLETDLAEREEELVGLRTSVEEGEATKEALDSARSEIEDLNEQIEGLNDQIELDKVGYQEAKTIIETHEAELVELRPLKGRLEALNHLLEKVKGESMAWHLVDALKECGTPEEVDEKFGEAKDSAEALLYAEDYIGGRARYTLADTDAEEEETEEDKERKAWLQKEGGLGVK